MNKAIWGSGVVGLSVAAAALALPLAACAASDTQGLAAEVTKDPDSGFGREQVPVPGVTGDSSNPAVVGTNRIVFVHASANLETVRVCFKALPGAKPFPRTKYLPSSNVLGIGAGGANFLDLTEGEREILVPSLAAGNGVKPDGGGVGPSEPPDRDAGAPGDVTMLVIESKELAGRESLNCGEVEQLFANRPEGAGTWTLKVPSAAFEPGPHVVALTGCGNLGDPGNTFTGRPDCLTGAPVSTITGTVALRAYSPFADGVPSDPNSGSSETTPPAPDTKPEVPPVLRSLHARFLNLQSESPKAEVAFGQVDAKAELPLPPAGAYGRMGAFLPIGKDFNDASYDTREFRLGGTKQALNQTMLQTQRLVAPSLLPSVYYDVKVPHLVVAVSENARAGTKRRLLSIPLTDPDAPPAPVVEDAGAK
jgi:hypothetical protein